MKKYTLILDNGIPSEVKADDNTIKQELMDFYIKNKDSEHPFDVTVLNEAGEDISESRPIEKIIQRSIAEVNTLEGNEHLRWVIYQLSSWRDTFEDDKDKDGYETKTWESINALIERIKVNKCTKKDYENILFHLWQKFYDQED